MKKILFFSLVLFLVFSCDREDEAAIFSEDIAEIKAYLETNNLTAIETDSGLHYIINEEGNGQFPTASSRVTVNYKGYYTDGQVFDSNNNITFQLTGVIAGWTEGIPKLSKGGSGTFLIPSVLGYGTNGKGSIPANTVLVFDVTLVDF